LQRHAGLFGGLDRVVVRFEMTVHDQRIARCRRFVGANDSAWRRFFRFDLWLLHMWLHIMIRINRIMLSSVGYVHDLRTSATRLSRWKTGSNFFRIMLSRWFEHGLC